MRLRHPSSNSINNIIDLRENIVSRTLPAVARSISPVRTVLGRRRWTIALPARSVYVVCVGIVSDSSLVGVPRCRFPVPGGHLVVVWGMGCWEVLPVIHRLVLGRVLLLLGGGVRDVERWVGSGKRFNWRFASLLFSCLLGYLFAFSSWDLEILRSWDLFS